MTLAKAMIYLASLLPVSKPRKIIYKILGMNIGKRVSIGRGTIIWAKDLSKITIEDDARIGENVRIYSQKVHLMEDSRINHNARIRGLNKFTLGFSSFIGAGAFIDTTEDVEIGDCVAIGPDSKIFTHDMSYQWVAGGLPFKTAPVKIGERTWFGSDVTLIAGVKVGSHSIIAPKAMVTKDVDSYGLYVGLPAKKIRDLKDRIEEMKTGVDLVSEVKKHLMKYLPERLDTPLLEDEETIMIQGCGNMLVFINGKLKQSDIDRHPGMRKIFFCQDYEKNALEQISSKQHVLFDLKKQGYTKRNSKIERQITSELRRMGLLFRPIK